METTESFNSERLVAVYAAPDAISGEIVRGLLEAEGIFAVVGEQVTQAYAPALQVAAGLWGEVCVRAADVELARKVLEAFDAGESNITEEELEDAAAHSYDPDV